MSVEVALSVGPARLDIAYEQFGEPDSPAVLLLMGLGTQMLGWPDGFCIELAARGLHVIRFDNRDIGLSSHLPDAPMPDVRAVMTGDTSSASYRLSDMAADTVGLLDHLGLQSAHLVGASMGGMIAQTMAIESPERVRSLTSIMSTTGDPSVGQATQRALAALLSPPAKTREEAIERTVSIVRVIGSPAFELDEPDLRWRAGLAYDRANDPVGVGRQLAAIAASGDRTGALGSVTVPTLVIHGADDPLVNVSGGRATARAIPGAVLVVLDGMGHHLSRELWREIVRRIDELVERAEERWRVRLR
ncbi:MAG TPA: alpha/beta fold hydrolase [Solirubrobacteraceae bacterium]|jgi:pimeloyl-ACP methyl ester carboxylesterase|nr:alpha/beta fold hydrolase [Solirubrobacteraceae bacterium]